MNSKDSQILRFYDVHVDQINKYSIRGGRCFQEMLFFYFYLRLFILEKFETTEKLKE